jgi:DNA-binding LytR/AlgR family response regulator
MKFFLVAAISALSLTFTSFNKEYALSSFEHRVLYFMVKPFSYARFLKSVLKSKNLLNIHEQENQENGLNYLFLKQPGQFIKLPFSDILYSSFRRLSNLLILIQTL